MSAQIATRPSTGASLIESRADTMPLWSIIASARTNTKLLNSFSDSFDWLLYIWLRLIKKCYQKYMIVFVIAETKSYI